MQLQDCNFRASQGETPDQQHVANHSESNHLDKQVSQNTLEVLA